MPVIGITLTLAGYLYLSYMTYNLNKESKELQAKKDSLNKDIRSLEDIKSQLTLELKTRDTVISIQDSIISNSKDSKTVMEGKKVIEEYKEPLIQQRSPVQTSLRMNARDASRFEKEGYEFLLERDVLKAIRSFQRSEKTYNGFHQVYEISVYLQKNKESLLRGNERDWKKTYAIILEKYSYKMPEDIRLKLERAIKSRAAAK